MNLLKQASIVLLIYFLGDIIQSEFNLPVPGSVLGMLILLVALCTGIIKLDMIDNISDFLLDNLAFFFVPAGVGLISCFSILKSNWFSILMISFLSTIIIISFTGTTIQWMIRRKK